MADENKHREYLTTTQAAELLSVSPDTVLKWVKAGKIKSHRTLGGHFRIPADELKLETSASKEPPQKPSHPENFQYCWEYLASFDGQIMPECRECITYRSRSRRCYELRDLPGGLGCLSLMCQSSCEDCEYYQLVNGQSLNILILSPSEMILKDASTLSHEKNIDVKFAHDEYSASLLIQSFRPDYIVVDCSFGKKRTATLCSNLFSDIRIPVARIIMTSKSSRKQEYCDKETFGWIKKPFTVQALKDCIQAVPKLDRIN